MPSHNLNPDYSFIDDEKFAEAAVKYGVNFDHVKSTAVAAVQAKARAYCPYSKFRVGAALLTRTSLPVTAVAEVSNDSDFQPSASSTESTSSSNRGAGQIIVGANIENCSYPVGTCAERAAFATAVTMGHVPTGRQLRVCLPGNLSDLSRNSSMDSGSDTVVIEGKGIAAVAVAIDSEEPGSPCGMCRQFMNEFLEGKTPIFMIARGGKWTVKTMGELLPMSFGPGDLDRGQGMG